VELQVLQRRLEDIDDLGAELVAISPATPDDSLSLQQKHDLRFEVLSDRDNLVARSWGLVFSVEGRLRELFERLGVDLARRHGVERWELPMPGTFVVDREGLVRFAFAQADYTYRAEPDDVLDAVRGLRSRNTGEGQDSRWT